jgi:hypothetical protein
MLESPKVTITIRSKTIGTRTPSLQMPKTKIARQNKARNRHKGQNSKNNNMPTKKNSCYDVISIGTVAVPHTIHRTNIGQNLIDSSTTSMTKS